MTITPKWIRRFLHHQNPPQPAPLPDRRVIQCNVTHPTKTAVAGARAYVILTNHGSGHDRIEVLVRSRGGRWIEIWQNIRGLDSFRVKTLPPEHPLYGRRRLYAWSPNDSADTAERWGSDATARALNEAREREICRNREDGDDDDD